MRLYLLRHGEVASHRGDVPLTADAERQAYEVGQGLGRRESGRVSILSGDTLRARETAAHLARGVRDTGGEVVGPEVGFALRNPDLYLAGARVDMVSSPEALADQVDALSPDDVASLDFFPEFISSTDRIGWWLNHESPPGEGAKAIADRIRSFAVSLVDPVPDRPEVVVAVTHSPLIRSVGLEFLGADIGEPPWNSGLLLLIDDDRTMRAELFAHEAT